MKDSPSSQGSQGTVHNSRNVLAMCIHKTMCLKQYEKHKGKMFSRKHSLAISKIILSECALLKVQKFSPLLLKLEVNKEIWKLVLIFYLTILRDGKGDYACKLAWHPYHRTGSKGRDKRNIGVTMPDTIKITTKEHVFVCLHFLNSVGRIKYFSFLSKIGFQFA